MYGRRKAIAQSIATVMKIPFEEITPSVVDRFEILLRKRNYMVIQIPVIGEDSE